VIRRINQEGVTILIVEQNVHLTLQTANFAYILENGEIVDSGHSQEMLHNARIQEAYLGL
jgi:branched-chain amino acid transport system ATP-binding protein